MAKTDATIGYFTVVEEERTGFTGGLLVLNRGGRPIEFQCTLPVRPTRAHEILFGSTLRDHILTEVIGPCLIKKIRTPLSLLGVDQPESLRLAEATATPIALVVEATEESEGPFTDDMLEGRQSVMLAGTALNVAFEVAETVRDVCEQLVDLPDAIEPFERIREAIKEAHRQVARARMAA